MAVPRLDRIDHIHVHVTDRNAAEEWFKRVLGLRRKKSLEDWAVAHGPLMLESESGMICLAVFERPLEKPNQSTIAFHVSGAEFWSWITHLSAVLEDEPRRVDHGKAWSVYFSDPDGNPFEITTYDYAEVTRHCGLQ